MPTMLWDREAMTVAELINQLQTMPQDAPVTFNGDDRLYRICGAEACLDGKTPQVPYCVNLIYYD